MFYSTAKKTPTAISEFKHNELSLLKSPKLLAFGKTLWENINCWHTMCGFVFFLVYVVWMICKTKIKVQTHYRWAYLFFNSVLACIQHSNRFLLQIPAKGSTINIYWHRGCIGSVAVCPGAEGCFCVCVCAPIWSFPCTEALLWCFWHAAVTFDWGRLPVPLPGSLLKLQEERQVKDCILN